MGGERPGSLFSTRRTIHIHPHFGNRVCGLDLVVVFGTAMPRSEKIASFMNFFRSTRISGSHIQPCHHTQPLREKTCENAFVPEAACIFVLEAGLWVFSCQKHA